MSNITDICNMIDSNKLSNSLDKNSKADVNLMINQLTTMVTNEKIKLTEQLNNIQSFDSKVFKIPTKYKKMSIEELEELFNSMEEIDSKISIYYTISKKIEIG